MADAANGNVKTPLLFSPFKLGGLSLRNRIVVSPMCQYSAVDGMPQPWHAMHVGSMAVSGAALVIMEATAVEPIGRISPNCLGLYSDAHEAAFAELLRGIRSYSDTPIGIQIGHAGRKASSAPFDKGGNIPPGEGGWQTVAPSPVAMEPDWPVPAELSEADIDAVVQRFADAARRADRAGFDHVEIHGAHGYLISSFLSPVANRRADRFGGSFENRMRLALMTASAVRAVWPSEKAIGIRLSATDHVENGITVDETAVVAKALRDLGVDYVAASSGGNSRAQRIPPTVPGYQVGYARTIGQVSGIDTMAVGMILDGPQAEGILSRGDAQLVAIGRAMLDDPRWGHHAAAALGLEPSYPRPHWRAAPPVWRGFDLVHRSSRKEASHE